MCLRFGAMPSSTHQTMVCDRDAALEQNLCALERKMEDRDRYLDEMRSYLERHPDGSPPPKEKILVDAVRKVWEENGKDVSSFNELERGARIEPLNK